MTHRRTPQKRQRRSLPVSSKQKTSLTQKGWFRGLSVLTAFSSSAAIIYTLTASLPAQAISIPSITSMQTTMRSVMQSDALSSAFRVTQAQTARYPQDVSRFMFEAATRKSAITTGALTGQKLLDLQLDMQPSVGITNDMMCAPAAERTLILTRDASADGNATHKTTMITGKYAATKNTKEAQRTRTHLTGYCDISEVNQGLCLPQDDGLGGADSNYAVIINNTRLTPETEQAAYAFMFNVIDPSQTDESICTTPSCKGLASHQRVYQAMGSMAHNAFINQINDSLIYNPGSPNNGKTAAEVLAAEKAKADAIAENTTTTTAPDGTVTTVTKNADGTVTTVIKKPDGNTTTNTSPKK